MPYKHEVVGSNPAPPIARRLVGSEFLQTCRAFIRAANRFFVDVLIIPRKRKRLSGGVAQFG